MSAVVTDILNEDESARREWRESLSRFALYHRRQFTDVGAASALDVLIHFKEFISERPAASPPPSEPTDEATKFVTHFLQQHQSWSAAELSEAVFLSEEQFVGDRELRARFAEALLSAAHRLLAHDPMSLAARMAIRKFASIAPVPLLERLSEFLRPPIDLAVKQTTLESIWNALAVDPEPPEEYIPLLSSTRTRVIELANLYASPEWLCSSQGSVLHAMAVLADLALSGESAFDRLSKFRSAQTPDVTDALFLVEDSIRSELDHTRNDDRRELMQKTLSLLADENE